MSNNTVSRPKLRQATACLLLFFYLILPVGGAASHYCFDGQEPAVSVHFDNFSGHDEHEEEEQHVDSEKRLFAENLVSKFSGFDCYLPCSTVYVDLASAERKSGTQSHLPESRHAIPWLVSPPLRGPPSISL